MTRRWYQFRAQARGAEIVIYDEIGAFGIPAKTFLDELKALGPVAELTVRINSPGGSVFDGVAIYDVRRVGVDAVYTPAGADPVPVRVIARRPDTIVGFGETRIHAETATFELRASGPPTRVPAISSPSVATPSSSRASRSGAIPTGSSGRLM